MHIKTWYILTAAVGLFAGWPFQAYAQERTREVAIDVRPFSADLSIAWGSSPNHLWGFLIGGGPDEINKTLVPEVDDTSSEYVTLEQIVRMGPFYRYESGDRLGVDVGVRVALGGVRGTSGAINAVEGSRRRCSLAAGISVSGPAFSWAGRRNPASTTSSTSTGSRDEYVCRSDDLPGIRDAVFAGGWVRPDPLNRPILDRTGVN